MRFIFLLLTLLMVHSEINAKIRILTFHYNLPELIEIQHKTLKKFLKEDYELIVFNDARELEHEKSIKKTCNKLGIRCVRFEPSWHANDPLNAQISQWQNRSDLYSHIGLIHPDHPSVRHCHVIQYALNQFGYSHDDLVALLDGDCFLSRPASFKEILGDNDIVGIRKEQGGIDYLWVVFSLFDPRKVPYKEDLKFHLDVVNNEIHDTGAHTYHYLKNHPNMIYQKFQGENSAGFYLWSDEGLRNYGFNQNEISFLRDLDSLKGFPWPITVEFHVNNHFIHLGNSSFGLPGHQEKLNSVKKFVRNILKKSS